MNREVEDTIVDFDQFIIHMEACLKVYERDSAGQVFMPVDDDYLKLMKKVQEYFESTW